MQTMQERTVAGSHNKFGPFDIVVCEMKMRESKKMRTHNNCNVVLYVDLIEKMLFGFGCCVFFFVCFCILFGILS